jgi:DNA polymerase III subunit alpha
LYSSLHAHSPNGSLLDSIADIKDSVKMAKEYNYYAMAVTDHGKMHSVINFYKECKKQDIKPIIGIEAYECDDIAVQDDTRYHLVLLATSNEGLKNLNIISSISHIDGFYFKPRVDLATLKKHSKGIIALSACLAGRISRLLMNEEYILAKEWVYKYKDTFENFYIELQNHNTEDSIKINKLLLKLAEKTNTPFVLTDDVHFINKEDIDAHSVFVQISQDRDVGESYTDCHMKSEIEIHSIMDSQIGYDNVCLGIENTTVIAEMCNVEIDLDMPNQMPIIKIPDGYSDMKDYYKHIINEGYIKRETNKLSTEQQTIVKDRLLKEFDTLDYLNYIDYFILLYKIVEKAKKRNIPLGFGRGSGSNCYSLYNLGITGIDSIKWGLDFNRFATKGRKSVADYDMDISKSRRKEMVEIAKEEFNESSEQLYTQVCPMSTFGTLSTKVAIKDIGKVLQDNGTYPDLYYSIRDEVAKLIPVVNTIDELGEEVETEIRLKDIIENNEKLTLYNKKYPLWLKYVMQLEGLPKTLGTHAAGVVITPKPIIEYCPLCLNKQKEIMIQYDMYNVLDDLHLVKLDFLGLDTLDVIDDTLKLANLTWEDINVDKIDLNDPKVYNETYKSGNCQGVFQMESAEAVRMCLEAQCEDIDSVIAINAANRPGTKDLFPDYVQNKLYPDKIKYIHEDLKEITKDSCGVLLYQEQFLAIFKLAGFPDEEVDIARRAIGHKEKETMLALEKRLKEGLKIKKWNDEQIEEIWALLVKQSGYAFNLGHSTSYGILSYVTAYLKTYYPLQFMTALLNSEKGNYGQMSKYINECKRLNIKVLEASINKSTTGFTASGDNILFGLSMIKNVGDSSTQLIIENRPFVSFDDYFEKCSPDISTSVALIKSGCFNEFEEDKRKLLVGLCEKLYIPTKYKELVSLPSKQKMYELNLIVDDEGFKNKEECLLKYNTYKLVEYNKKEELRYEKYKDEFESKYLVGEEADWQMEALSMYLTKNPYDEFFKLLTPYGESTGECIVAGTIIDIKRKSDKNGNRYAYVDLLNHEGIMVECTIWASNYGRFQSMLSKTNKIICDGIKEENKYFINNIKLIDEWLAQIKFNKKIS